MAYTDILMDLTPVLATSHLRRCAAMLEQTSGRIRLQLLEKSEMSMFKQGQATHRQSTVRWPVLEFETLDEALGTLTIATTVCFGTLAF